MIRSRGPAWGGILPDPERPRAGLARWTWKKLDSLYIIAVFPIFPTQLIGLISMPAIRVKENEPFEVAIRRFKRTVEKPAC